MDIKDLLMMMGVGAVIGCFGQCLRVIVGLNKAKDEASQKGVDFGKDVFDGNRLLVSLLIGAISGGLGTLTLTNFEPLPGGKMTGQMFFGILGIGYAGTDFIEGFIAKYLPKKTPAPDPKPNNVLIAPANLQRSFSAVTGPLVRSLVVDAPTLSHVELSCKSNYAAGKADCNLFAKLVAAEFGVTLRGDANEIARQIAANAAAGNGWTYLGNGVDAGKLAAAAAERGELVLGARDEGDGQHGHVVVVVGGPLAKDLYPRAYWGTINYDPNDSDTWGINKTTNYAWNKDARDSVTYASRVI